MVSKTAAGPGALPGPVTLSRLMGGAALCAYGLLSALAPVRMRSIRSAASCIASGMTWLYVFIVRLIWECPSCSMITRMLAPWASRSEAHVWRRSWNRMRGSPASRRSR